MKKIYILQLQQISLRIRTNTISNLDKYIFHPAIPTTADAHNYTSTLRNEENLHFAIATNKFENQDKYYFKFGQIHLPPGNSHHRRRPQLHQHFRCFFKYILRFQQIKSTIRTNTISNFDKYTLHLTIPIAAHFLHFWHLIDMFDTPIFYINSFSTRNQGYNQL